MKENLIDGNYFLSYYLVDWRGLELCGRRVLEDAIEGLVNLIHPYSVFDNTFFDDFP